MPKKSSSSSPSIAYEQLEVEEAKRIWQQEHQKSVRPPPEWTRIVALYADLRLHNEACKQIINRHKAQIRVIMETQKRLTQMEKKMHDLALVPLLDAHRQTRVPIPQQSGGGWICAKPRKRTFQQSPDDVVPEIEALLRRKLPTHELSKQAVQTVLEATRKRPTMITVATHKVESTEHKKRILEQLQTHEPEWRTYLTQTQSSLHQWSTQLCSKYPKLFVELAKSLEEVKEGEGEFEERMFPSKSEEEEEEEEEGEGDTTTVL